MNRIIHIGLHNLFLLCVFPTLLLASESYTFKSTIDFALVNSPRITSANKNTQIQDLNLLQAQSKNDVVVDLIAQQNVDTYYPLHKQFSDDPFEDNKIALSAKKVLYDNDQAWFEEEKGQIQKQIATQKQLQERDKLIWDLVLQYYQYSKDCAVYEIQKEERELLSNQEQLFFKQYREGIKTKQDYLRIKTQAQRLILDVLATEESLNKRKNQLKILMGADHSGMDFSPILVAKKHLEKVAINFPPDTKGVSYDEIISRLEAKLSQIDTNSVQRKYWPQPMLTTELSYNNRFYQQSKYFGQDNLRWNVFLGVQFNIWDHHEKDQKIQVSELDKSVKFEAAKQANLELRAAMEETSSTLVRLAKSHALSRELMALADEAYLLIKTNFSEGKVSYIDFITSMDDLLKAKMEYQASSFVFLEKLAQWEFYKGTLYEAYSTF